MSNRLGPHALDDDNARFQIDQLAASLALEEESAAGPICFGPRIRLEPFPEKFTLPRDTPKYSGDTKPEDWLVDYTTAVNIAGGNKQVAVRYVPLMLTGSARTWLNCLPAHSINAWLDFQEAFICNFSITYKRPGRPFDLSQ